MREQTAKKIATYIIFPLVLLLVIYSAYRIADVVLWKVTKAEITLTNSAGEQKISLNKCIMVGYSNYHKEITLSDGTNNALMVYEHSGKVDIRPILYNQEHDWIKDCTIAKNTLAVSEFSGGGRTAHSLLSSSAKGEIAGKCAYPEGEFTFQVKIHACQ